MDDSDLDALEREHGPALRSDFDDDRYDDLPFVPPLIHPFDDWPYPDLANVPREDWKEVLRDFSPRQRRLAVGRLAGKEGYTAAIQADLELEYEERERRKQALARSAPPPSPRTEARYIPRRAQRQVSFRMTELEREELTRVALAYGVSGAQLARMLTIRGVRRALAEEP